MNAQKLVTTLRQVRHQEEEILLTRCANCGHPLGVHYESARFPAPRPCYGKWSDKKPCRCPAFEPV